MGKAVDGVKSRLAALKARAAAYIADLRTVDNTQRGATASAANLTAQFNDIGVMMAAGQNPLQLAIQQGTQITQVIGPMGAAGAARALGSAFIGMMNPISIVTLLSIAAGAATVQWLTGASEEAETLEDTLTAAADAIELFGEKAGTARLNTSELLKEFGTASPEMRAVLKDMAALAKIDAFKAVDKTADSVRGLVLELSWWDERSAVSASQDFLGLGSVGRANREAGAQFANNLELLSRSNDMAEKFGAALDVRAQLLATAGGVSKLNTEQRAFYDGLTALIRDLSQFQKEEKAAADASLAARREQMALYAQSRSTSNDELQKAEDLLATMQEANEIRAAEIRFGRDSAEASELRSANARREHEAMLATLDVSEDLKDELRAAFEHQEAMAGLDIATGIGSAANEAQRLAQELGISLETAKRLAALGPQGLPQEGANGYSGRGGDPRQMGGSSLDWNTRQGTEFLENWKPPRKSRGGGKSEHDKSREAIKRLIEREKERLAVLRATDPVLREMARVSDILKGATDEERKAVEKLIGERLREQGVIEETAETKDFFATTGMNALEALALQGASTAEVWDQVKAALARAALQAALLGEGPLAKFFGGGGDGGLFGTFLGAIGLADGGYVTGTGGERSDQVPILGSPGEFMVNAPATRKYRHILEAMNAGSDMSSFARPAFADGGLIAPPVGTAPGTGAAGHAGRTAPAVVQILPSPLFKAVIQEQTQGAIMEAVEDYDRNVAPETARRAIDDPWRTG
ncbi:phage tail length tape measure family protein [Phaeobacter inhibens]|uniref:phage tail length tape measure family protein n=1 Tax=Phaeobacter inhibens TaxID=221822 RepID=UPI00076BB9CA|nr:phage tail length tape measure family protein [Phaeobacter inhibens]KXF92087.1 hypothetical protein AT574_03785 [Phaeobacter inhibens]WHP69921.1 phage tail length tape measure family protein [Phaeobacter inhibens]